MKFKFKRNLILASSSKRRKKILKENNINFRCIHSNVDENKIIKIFEKTPKSNLVRILALSKAFSVFLNLESKNCTEIIAGFDTIVVKNNKVISKPKNKKDALKKLLFLSGKTHSVYTAFALIDLKTSKVFLDCEKTSVKMKRFSKTEAISYINTNEPMDKAGAYAIQGKGSKFIEKISGDYLNVVGLPIKKFMKRLQNLK